MNLYTRVNRKSKSTPGNRITKALTKHVKLRNHFLS